MSEDVDLDVKIMRLWAEANGMLQTNLLDSHRALALQKRMRDCADLAHEAGYTEREKLLRLTANNLEARFPPLPE